ncbi:uncharacterized protein LOC127259983 [Andrographis paniculata]|uniref:uncharacterized protein LOC127259983 n=1 Tax=Andrographis paniculata TaxID=175694 RepID=UPI0021E77180|nr:uncharacterized protein LOC127259983 [Andrographis paniculata]
MHKSSKKVTIPKQPELETHLRALNRRSKCSSTSSKSKKQKQKAFSFNPLPLNQKALSVSQPKQTTFKQAEFQSVVYMESIQTAEDKDWTDDMWLDSPPTEHFCVLSLGGKENWGLDEDLKTAKSS